MLFEMDSYSLQMQMHPIPCNIPIPMPTPNTLPLSPFPPIPPLSRDLPILPEIHDLQLRTDHLTHMAITRPPPTVPIDHLPGHIMGMKKTSLAAGGYCFDARGVC